MTTAAIGSTSPNSQRHEATWSTTPDTAGPSAGATEIASMTLPITRPRSCSGTIVISVVISSGSITAVPAACTTRPATSSEKTGASAHIAVPSRKTAIAVVNAWRVVTRCRNQPVTGMTTAMVSMNAVDSHCALRADTSSSTMSRGIALTMIVSLRITTNVASTSQRSTAYGDSTRSAFWPVAGVVASGTGAPSKVSQVVVMPVKTGTGGRTHRTTRRFLVATGFPGLRWWVTGP